MRNVQERNCPMLVICLNSGAYDACIKYLPEFERRAKALAKKYKSFVKDYDAFLDSFEEKPVPRHFAWAGRL